MDHGHEPRRVRLDRLVIPAGSLWSRLTIIGLVLGLAGIGASLLLARNDPHQFYFSWLVSFLFFLRSGSRRGSDGAGGPGVPARVLP